MRKILIILMLLFLLQNFALFAGKIEYKYYFTKPQITKQGDYHRIEMDGIISISEPGKPELPCKSVQLLLPQSEQAVRVSVIYTGKNDLPGEYKIYPTQKPYPISYQGEIVFTEPDPEIYNSNKPFPEKLHTKIQTQYLRGHSIALLNIFPVQYQPASGKLSFFSEMKVIIETEQTVEAENSFNNFYRYDKMTNKRVKNIIDNTEQIRLYPSQSNTRSGNNKYVIITSNLYSSYFESFAEFKTKHGYNVLIKTTEDIYSEYSGVDNQDEIRNFIKYAYQNLGTEYVLLGGDTEIVPHRGLYGWVNTSPTPTEDFDIPADLYYAAIDRVDSLGSGTGPDWNVDNDDKWGETSEADYIAEIYIGRISADSGTEFSSALNKQMLYQQSPVTTDIEKAIMVGEQLDDDTWGCTYKHQIKNGGTFDGYTTEGFPENYNIQLQYEVTSSWTWTDLRDKMNDGTNIINHLGHSNPDFNMKFSRSDVTNSNLTSNGTNHNFYIIYTQGCYAASFDNRWWDGGYGSENGDLSDEYDPEDCIAEKFTTISNGCVAFIGNSRYGWYNPGGTNSSSQYLDRQFFDALFGENIYRLGEINDDSKEDGASHFNTWDSFRWSYYCVNLFGDPSLDVWTALPQNLTATYSDTLFLNTSGFTVSVTSSGNPVEDALVCIMKDDEVYETGETDAFGDITLPLSFQDEGIMYVTVSAHNFIPCEDSVLVLGHLECSVNPTAIYADETSTSTIYAYVKDSCNNTISINSLMINFSIISGSTSAHLVGTNPAPTIDGIAQITLCADDTPGIVKIAADNDGLKADTVKVYVITDPSNIIVSDPIMIDTSSTSYQRNPKVAFDGTNYFTVWEDDRNPNWDIYGIRLSATGEVLDDSAFLIINDGYDYDMGNPDIVYGGNSYLVICRHLNSNLGSFYARVSTVGTLIDTVAHNISHYYILSPLLSYCGDTYIAITARSSYFYSTIIDESGNGSDVGQVYSNQNISHSHDITFNGNHYQLVWYGVNTGGNWNIYTRSIDIFGNFFDNYTTVDTSYGDQLYPTIASDGNNFLVVWEDRSDGNNYNISGARINNNGEVIDDPPIVISDNTDNQQLPSIAFDGTLYWVVWADSRDGGGNNIYGARVMPSGVVLDPTGILLVDRTSSCNSPHITHGTDDQLVVVYSSYDLPPYDNYRIYASIIGKAEEISVLELTDASGAPGTSSSWSYATLNALEEISTLQFTMKFNSLLSVDSLKLANQFSNMELDYNVFPDSVNILVYSQSGYTIKPENEPVVYFYYSVSLSASLGDIFPLTLSNVVISDANANAMARSLRNGNFYVTSKGDINFDFIVNALDLQRCINIILGRPPSPTPAEMLSADVAPLPDGDGSVDILDITGIVNIILGRSRSIQIASKSNPKSRTEAVLSVEDAVGIPGSSNIPVEIKLNNDESVDGIQFSLFFENNILAVDSVSLSPRSSNMTLAYNTWADSIKVLIYSASGDNILPDTSSIATVFFTVSENATLGDTTNIQINGIVLSDSDANPIPCTGDDGLFQVEGNPAYANIRVFLEGSYNAVGNTMNCLLTLPTISPYDNEDIGSLPSVTGHSLVDWIQVKLRITVTGSTVDSCNSFLLEDGSVVDVNGNSSLPFYDTAGNEYYIVIHHRNHLDIMSAVKHSFGSSPLDNKSDNENYTKNYNRNHLTKNNLVRYTFEGSQRETTNIDLTIPGSIYGDGYQELETGVIGMYSGDINNDGEVTTSDYTNWYNEYTTGSSGYQITDLNMDGEVTTSDYTKWYNNFILGASSSIPNQTGKFSGGSKKIMLRKIEKSISKDGYVK